MAKKKKYYAVAKGRCPGLYTEWFGPGGAETQVSGFNGAEYKSFATRNEAIRWLLDRGVRFDLPAEPYPVLPEKSPSPGQIVVYTDGSSMGNPGPGGWGVVRLTGNGREERSGGYQLTTNNRMELLACIEGVKDLPDNASVLLFSDSQYVVHGITRGWAEGWRARGWMRNRTERAENADLWNRLLDEVGRLNVQFEWVRGHDGNPGNERCDQLATAAASGSGLPKDPGYPSSGGMNQQSLFE